MLAKKYKAQYCCSKNQQSRGGKNYNYVMSRRVQQQSNGVGVKNMSTNQYTGNKSMNCVTVSDHKSGPCSCTTLTSKNALVASTAGDYMERLKQCAISKN